MTKYTMTMEIQVPKQLTEAQQDTLRKAVLGAIDDADEEGMIPYRADVVTATVKEGE